MDTKHLETFISVAETKNFSKTAELLDYAQSTVSTHIEKLEQELNIPLFVRKKHGITLTNEGEKFVKYAKQILNVNIDFHDEINDLNSNKEIKIAMQESQYLYRYAKFFSDWMSRNKNISLKITSAHSSFIMKEKIAKGEIDLAFITDNILYNHSINRVLLSADDLILVSNKKITIKEMNDFTQYRLLLTETGCSYREALESFFRKMNINNVSKTEFLGIQSLIQSLISIPNSIALLPRFIVETMLEEQLFEVNIDYNWNTIQTYLITSNNEHSQQVVDLVESIKKI